MRSLLSVIAGFTVVVLLAASAPAADWPMARADAARSGYTAEPLPDVLSLRWSAEERHAPQSAWPSIDRMPYDRAYHVVVAGGTVFYGTSSDCKVVARDALTGKPRWTFVTDAPVRFAPAVWQDRVVAAGDDGLLYCLDAADGQLRWKLRGGPRSDMLLGNDRMISRWPARGGPVVLDGVVYFGAGIWPSEGIFLYAVDVAAGKVLWRNDTAGAIEMDQPHPGARAKSGIAAQGHFAAEGDALLVPTGRAVPAAFDRATGTLRYFHLQANRGLGGSEAAIIDGHFFNGGTMFALADGALEQTLGKPIGTRGDPVVHATTAAIQVAAHPRWIVYGAGSRLAALDRRKPLVEKEVLNTKGKKTRVKALAEPAWKTELPSGAICSLIVAGDTVVAGGVDAVVGLDAASGRVKWSAGVHGSVFSLAASGARLYASTDRGAICCLDGTRATPEMVRAEPDSPLPEAKAAYAEAADEIVRASGVSEGYCLDLACGRGLLALELAKRTKLRIYGVEADPGAVQAARQMLDAAGLYGVRVTIHQADPANAPYPDHFADLVVSGRSVLEGVQAVPGEAAARMQRPCGGVACFGRAGAMQLSRRGPLQGAGDWTHLYADAANTLCSTDTRLRGPLEMLWFRDTDLVMPSRHGRGPAPLVAGARMYVEGLNALRAVNIYNGATLWEFPLPGVLRPFHQDHLTGVAATGSNLCLGDDRLYLCIGPRCLVLDASTGEKTAEWQAPLPPDGKARPWGYLAYRDKMLFGTLANQQHQVKESWRSFLGKLDMTDLLSESSLLFAMDGRTGRVLWTFAPERSLRHNAIAVGAGRVYVIDRTVAVVDTPQPAAAASKAAHPTGRLACLDSRTGKVLWETREDVFGTLLVLSERHDALLMSYQPTRFKLDSELGNRMACYRASDGKRLWSVEGKYQSRPIVNDRVIYAEPGKWDLLSGERLPFEFSRSYGCGILSGSRRLLLFRSATLGYVDLERNEGTENYGGIRPGCWVNAIPAGGLVLLGDAASWCTCSYLNQATIALQPRTIDTVFPRSRVGGIPRPLSPGDAREIR